MANTLNANVSINFSASASGAQLGAALSKAVTVSGSTYQRQVYSATTSDTTVGTTAVGTPIGWALIRNLDLTNFISLSVDGSTYPTPLIVQAGEFWFGRWNANALHIKADTATVQVEVTLFAN